MKQIKFFLLFVITLLTFATADAQVIVRVGRRPYFHHGRHWAHRAPYYRHHHRYYRYY